MHWVTISVIICFYHRLEELLEKAMTPHSSILAWRIQWMEECGGLQSMGSLRVGHDWATSLSLFTFMHWRRQWQPTPVFLPGESQGRGSLVDWHLWGSQRLRHDWSDLAAAAAAEELFNIYEIKNYKQIKKCILSQQRAYDPSFYFWKTWNSF